MNKSLQDQFGNIDIYLFDQLLKGRFDGTKTVLDVGCGKGRNIIYFLKNQFEVFGIDSQPESIAEVIKLSKQLAPGNSPDNFVVAKADAIPFKDEFFDLVICNAMLHFAENKNHFESMLDEIWRVLKPGGFLFVRLASDIGIENLVIDSGNGQYLLPDGSKRYLVNLEELLNYTRELNAILAEPVKTTNVQNLRSMTTWCLLKNR
jgi:tellurite methyltransferase